MIKSKLINSNVQKRKLQLDRFNKENIYKKVSISLEKIGAGINKNKKSENQVEAKIEETRKNIRLPSLEPLSNEAKMLLQNRKDGHKSLTSSGKSLQSFHTLENKKNSSSQTHIKQLKKSAIEYGIKYFLDSLQSSKIIRPHFDNLLVTKDKLNSILMFLIYVSRNSKRQNSDFIKMLTQDQNFYKFDSKLLKGQILFKELVKSKCKLNHEQSNCQCDKSSDVPVNLQEQECKILQNKNKQLLKQIIQKRQTKQLIDKQIVAVTAKVESLNQKLDRLNTQYKQKKTQLSSLIKSIQAKVVFFEQLENKKKIAQNYIKEHSNSKLKQAAFVNKNLVIDMIQFSNYLKYHPLGQRQYEKTNYCSQTQNMLNRQVKQFQRYLIDLSQSSLQVKLNSMKNFVMKMNHQSNLIIVQLITAISQKTSYIQRYTHFIQKWYATYQQNKQILQNLNDNLNTELINFDCVKAASLNSDRCFTCNSCPKNQNQLMQIVSKIIQICQIGLCFY